MRFQGKVTSVKEICEDFTMSWFTVTVSGPDSDPQVWTLEVNFKEVGSYPIGRSVQFEVFPHGRKNRR